MNAPLTGRRISIASGDSSGKVTERFLRYVTFDTQAKEGADTYPSTPGQLVLLRHLENELVALDDRTFRWRLKRRYSKLLVALGKVGTPSCFIMPARIAATDPFKPINEYVGSGPMKLVRDEWVPGARAVFQKFADYVPRDDASSWLAGGKRMLVDRVEWIVMADPATASAALQNGEVDWWETPMADLVPLLKKTRNVMVHIADTLGNLGSFRMNHLHPPFNNVYARFHAGHSALHGRGRRHPQRAAQPGCGQAPAR